MVHTVNTPASSRERADSANAERGRALLEELNTLQHDPSLFSEDEQKLYEEHQAHLVEDQARMQELSLQADLDPDAEETLHDEMTDRYRARIQERGDIGPRSFVYGAFGRTRDASGEYTQTASDLMQESIDRVADSNVPGSTETAQFLSEIMQHLDPEEQESSANPYLIMQDGKRVSYQLKRIAKDLASLRARAHALAKSLPDDHAGRNAVLTEIRKFENVLVQYQNIDPGLNHIGRISEAMNRPDPIGFAPKEFWKTAAVVLLGGVTIWALANRNWRYATVSGLILLYVLYGKRGSNEFSDLRTLSRKDVQAELKLLSEGSDPQANAEMVRDMIQKGSPDRDRIAVWLKKGKVLDSDIASVTNQTLRQTLTNLQTSKARVEWLTTISSLNENTLETAEQYILAKGNPTLPSSS